MQESNLITWLELKTHEKENKLSTNQVLRMIMTASDKGRYSISLDIYKYKCRGDNMRSCYSSEKSIFKELKSIGFRYNSTGAMACSYEDSSICCSEIKVSWNLKQKEKR